MHLERNINCHSKRKKNAAKPQNNDEALRMARQQGVQVDAVKKCNISF